MSTDISGFYPELQDRIRVELYPDEKPIWAGQPLRRLFHQQAIRHAATGVVWTTLIFSFFAAWMWFTPRREWTALSLIVPLILIGVPFIFVGGLLLYSPFQISRRASLTGYVLTNRRAIVFSCGQSVGSVTTQVQSYGRDMLPTLEVRERADGSGDLILEPIPKLPGTLIIWTPRIGFMAIENVRHVENLVRNTLGSEASVSQTTLPNRFANPFPYH